MQDIKPFFSVVIPTLNEEKYLPRLLTDLAEQVERSFEVYVVDAGSDDQTVAQASLYTKKIPLQILQTKIKNVSSQRNLGAKRAKGIYLLFFDADVQLPRGFLANLKSQLTKQEPDFGTTLLRADSSNIYDQAIATTYNLTSELSQAVDRPFIPGFDFIVKKQVYDQTQGFNEKVVHGEDYEYSQRLFDKGYKLVRFKKPRLIFSLRRYREEGRLKVIRKHAQATLHVLIKGPITKDIFSYPMGGGWYQKMKKDHEKNGFEKIEVYMKRFMKLFIE